MKIRLEFRCAIHMASLSSSISLDLFSGRLVFNDGEMKGPVALRLRLGSGWTEALPGPAV